LKRKPPEDSVNQRYAGVLSIIRNTVNAFFIVSINGYFSRRKIMHQLMETSILTMDQKKFFWAPSVRWERIDQEIRIEIFSYSDFVLEIFPRFYFVTQKGISLHDLTAEFTLVDSRRLQLFIQDLIHKKILIAAIMTPQEIFFPQKQLFKNEYSETIIFDAEELAKFKKKQLNRNCVKEPTEKIILNHRSEYPAYISERKSYRIFDTKAQISFDTFSKLISIFKQRRRDDQIAYYYASAGGLYPIDVYIHIKEDRVANIKRGLYYYHSVENSLNLMNSDCAIPEDVHYFQNKLIHKDSAFSIFLIYNAEATMPKYGGMAYFYAAIDSGLMVGALTSAAELCNIGLCSVGEINFTKIEKQFKLNENQVFFHLIEGGLKSSEEQSRTIPVYF
jgi:SagB-type dehydrogenase family enzyme